MRFGWKKIKGVIFIVVMFLAMMQYVSSEGAKTSSSKDLTTLTKILKKKCIQCHGGVKDGKKKIKGKTDIAKMLESGIKIHDSKFWSNVIDSVESGDMPPSDSKVEISASEKSTLVDSLQSHLNVRTIKSRLLTPLEISNSINQLFDVDDELYNSFARLSYHVNPLVRYPTMQSEKLISPNFIKDVGYALDSITEIFVLLNRSKKPPPPEGKHNMIPETYKSNMLPERDGPTAASAASFIDRDYSLAPKKPQREKKILTDEEAEKYREKLKAWGEAFKKHIATQESKLCFDLRNRNRDFMKLKDPIYVHHQNYLTPGRYRLSFKATALNRHKVKEVYKKYPKKVTDKFLNFGWEKLMNEKCRLDISFDGMHSNNFRGLLANAIGKRQGKVFKSFEIEDNVEKVYTVEFEVNHPNSLAFEFSNGPRSVQGKYTELPYVGRRVFRTGKAKGNNPGREYPLPCIRFLAPVQLEKLSSKKELNDFDFKYKKITEENAKQKISLFLKSLTLEHMAKRLTEYFDELPKSLSVEERYATSLKFISMSPEFLLIDLTGNLEDDSRYMSYCLLKIHPSKMFKDDLKMYRSGEMSPKDFAKKIVENPNFESFIKTFVSKWLGYGVELDEKKYFEHVRKLTFNEETTQYILQLFKRNRPSLELFHSEYKVLNNSLATHYGLKASDLKHYDYKIVETKKYQSGIFDQGSFYISKSSGVDPLPFQRAAWAYENIFDKRLPPPPSDVNAAEFKSNEGKMTFKESTFLHSKNEQCAGCHKKIDPIAFAFHNFDTVGVRIPEQDSAAEEMFKQSILSARKTIASAFTRNLIAYIIGRETTVFDRSAINDIISKTVKNNYCMVDILSEIIEVYFKK